MRWVCISATSTYSLEKSAPVIYSVPEPAIMVPVINMMAKLPPHPYAAILLYDFILIS